MAQQYDEQIQHVAEGERILTAGDGCTIVQTADGAVALTADARIALGPATHAAACWREDRKACAVALTDEEGSPRHRVAFLTTKGLVDTVECGPSVAPNSHVTGAAFRAGDGALGVLYGDGALRVALLGLDGGRVVEEAACVSTAAAGGTALAVVGDRFAVGAADGSCAVVKARLCAVLGQAAIARDLDLPASEAGEPVTALAVRTRRRNYMVASMASTRCRVASHTQTTHKNKTRRRRTAGSSSPPGARCAGGTRAPARP